jgi:OOP family OmpA-OmpF porin
MGELVTLFRDLNEALDARGRRGQVEVIGHTDNDGSETTNDALSRARANWMITQLPVTALDALDIRASGIGSAAPLVSGVSESEKGRNRRVSFRVRLTS